MDDKGELIGYTEDACNNCGRMRVELYENGDRVCERCNWNQNKNKYEPTDI